MLCFCQKSINICSIWYNICCREILLEISKTSFNHLIKHQISFFSIGFKKVKFISYYVNLSNDVLTICWLLFITLDITVGQIFSKASRSKSQPDVCNLALPCQRPSTRLNAGRMGCSYVTTGMHSLQRARILEIRWKRNKGTNAVIKRLSILLQMLPHIFIKILEKSICLRFKKS